jgi:hypothetical protein
MYRYLFQVIADKEDKREQLIETLETHKYHFEQVCVFVCVCVCDMHDICTGSLRRSRHIYTPLNRCVCVCVYV